MAFVNRASLPSSERRFFYVAGESQSGNDLDLQFENDDALKFYTAAGGHTSFTPPPAQQRTAWKPLSTLRRNHSHGFPLTLTEATTDAA
jgi:hypothetical protein